MYRPGDVSSHRACCERGYPTHFEGEILVKAQDQQVTACSPRIETECLLTRSMLIKTLSLYFMNWVG